MKKGAALLMVVLFIAIFGAIVITITRSGLLNSIFANNIISAMRAEEASQSGLEVGLLHFKIFGNDTSWTHGGVTSSTMCVDVSENGEPGYQGCSGKQPTDFWADVSFAPVSGDLIKITSTGHFGYIIKKHSLTQIAEPWL